VTTEKIIYSEAIRTVEQQERSAVEIRHRAAGLLAVLAVVTSFLGAHAVSGSGGIGGWGWMGLIGAMVSTIFALVILLPDDGWTFGLDPLMMLEDHDAHPGSPNEVYRFLAERRGAHIERHHVLLRAQYWNMRYAILAFVLSVGAWLLQLGGS
jgi:hypothetical protein